LAGDATYYLLYECKNALTCVVVIAAVSFKPSSKSTPIKNDKTVRRFHFQQFDVVDVVMFVVVL